MWNGESLLIVPDEMYRFLKALYDIGTEDSWGLRSAILTTLDIEEV